MDGSGNLAVTGHFDGVTDFGGGMVASYVHPSLGPTVDIFVAAYTPAGGYRWARTIGSDSTEEGKGVASDLFGNVLVTGYQGSYAVDYGGGPQYLRSGLDIFIAKYSSAGSWVWSKTIGGLGYDQGSAITSDSAGNVYVTGFIGTGQGGVDFGGGILNSSGGSDAFLVKYSSTGAHVWSLKMGGGSNDQGNAVAIDSAGNVFVAGTFESTVDFGTGPLSSAGFRDVFLAKYTSTGQIAWVRRFGGSGDDTVQGMDLDSAGNLVLAGKFQGSISFGGGNMTSAGVDDAFLVKLSGADGSHVWSKRFGSTNGDVATGVAVDGSNNVVVTGYFYATVDFGGGPLTAFGIDVFAAKYSTTGAHVWSKRFGAGGSQLGDSVAIAPSGDVTLSGFFNGTMDFGAGPMTSSGAYDVFTACIGR